jgi:hypothetical protein
VEGHHYWFTILLRKTNTNQQRRFSRFGATVMIVFLREVNTLMDYNSIVLSGLLYSKDYYPVFLRSSLTGSDDLYLLQLSPKKIQQIGVV